MTPTTYNYESESHMRQANPWLSNHLCTIAVYEGGRYTAQTNNRRYTWK